MSTLAFANSYRSAPSVTTHGLAPVSCYDPYFARMVHYIRAILADQKPVMIRLHSASQYPASGDKMYKVDLEGHAVLIVGYDDEREAFAIADPWQAKWGGIHSGLRWVGYDELSLIVVDGTSDYFVLVVPLDVDVDLRDTGEHPVLHAEIGFYNPPAIVMDRDNQHVSEVAMTITRGSAKQSVSLPGHWAVGEKAVLDVKLDADLRNARGDIAVQAFATIRGARPYEYEDKVGVDLVVSAGEHAEVEGTKRVAHG